MRKCFRNFESFNTNRCGYVIFYSASGRIRVGVRASVREGLI